MESDRECRFGGSAVITTSKSQVEMIQNRRKIDAAKHPGDPAGVRLAPEIL